MYSFISFVKYKILQIVLYIADFLSFVLHIAYLSFGINILPPKKPFQQFPQIFSICVNHVITSASYYLAFAKLSVCSIGKSVIQQSYNFLPPFYPLPQTECKYLRINGRILERTVTFSLKCDNNPRHKYSISFLK